MAYIRFPQDYKIQGYVESPLTGEYSAETMRSHIRLSPVGETFAQTWCSAVIDLDFIRGRIALIHKEKELEQLKNLYA